ncbi:membrane protein [Marinicauda pacifica]|uniref:DUF4010 domain-containing protein n=1 Tax=Marinicauda pacifica TaxID=1133559 RepID=A0A4S2HAS0_9PROT|nr:DUF4010 domain-containing protein [Marinicauda pacifica]TGY93025.1 DUF4010 domain-containing protein [Marinicauda pacifica]GGE42216.1 membrane protein [Marinicauda pacifica]
MEFFEMMERLAAALAIGFLVGVERGWKQREDVEGTRVAGLRTFTLIGLLGGLSGILGLLLGPAAFLALVFAFALPWTLYKASEIWREDDVSITGLIAGIAVFALGALASLGHIQEAAAAGIALTAILAGKGLSHGWLRQLTWPELRSALLLLAATLLALPLLPDRALDPWGAFNPHELWLLTLLLAAASFAGYAGLRIFGPRHGLFVAGVAGALVSSTAMTIDMARRAAKGEAAPRLAASVATLGNGVMMARVLVLLAIVAPALLTTAGPPLAVASLTSILIAFGLGRRALRHADSDMPATPGNPLDLRFIAQIALLLVTVVVLARLASHVWGEQGLVGFAAIAGLVDVDAITLAAGRMVTNDTVPHATGVVAVLVAVGADTVSKGVLGGVIGRQGFAWPYGLASLAGLAAGTGTYAAMLWL